MFPRIAFIGSLCFLSSCSLRTGVESYFPLAIENTWTYSCDLHVDEDGTLRDKLGLKGELILSIVEKVSGSSGNIYKMKWESPVEPDEIGYSYVSIENGLLTITPPDFEPEMDDNALFSLKEPLTTGNTWNDDVNSLKIISTDGEIMLDSKLYKNLLKVKAKSEKNSISLPEEYEIYFSKNIGLVKMRTGYTGRGGECELKDFSLIK